MRKTFLYLLVTMLLLVASLALADAPVYVLTDAPSPDAKILGTAVLTDPEGLEYATSAICVQGMDTCYLKLGDDYAAVTGINCADNEHIAVLTLDECSAQVESAALTVAAPVTYTGVKADGTLITGTVADIAYDANDITMTARLESGIMPGAVLLASDGSVAGVVLYPVNEGVDRYCVSRADRFDHLLSKATLKTDDSPAGRVSLILQPAEYEPGTLFYSWDAEGMTAYCMVPGNDYLTRLGKEDSGYLAAVPGHTLIVWLMPEGAELDDINDILNYPYAVYDSPVEQLTMHSFADTSAYLTVAQPGVSFRMTEQIPAVDVITVADLTGGKDVYLQVTSTYEIDHDESYVMTAVLTLPDGRCFYTVTGYAFGPDYMPEDVWHWDLTDLFANANELTTGGLQPGEYDLTYYIAGQKASEVNFTVVGEASAEETTPAAPEAETPDGFSMDGGALTIDWSDKGTAEKWHLYIVMEGNIYYSWIDTAETSVTMCVVPGRNYAFALEAFKDGREPDMTAIIDLGMYTMPEAGRYTDHNFKEVITRATTADPAVVGLNGEGMLAELPEITAADLAAGKHIYLQVASTYEVDEVIDEQSLTVLILPDGQCFAYNSGYFFSPEYAANDSWYVDLTAIMALDDPGFASLLEQSGTYTLEYYIAGKLAHSCTFEIR